MERELLGAAIGSRAAFEALDSLMEPDKDLSEISRILWAIIQEYYYRDQAATTCSKELMADTITRKYPRHVEVLTKVLDDLVLECISIPNILAELVSLRKLRLAREISTAMDRGDENKADRLVDEFAELADMGLEADRGEIYTGANAKQALGEQSSNNLIRLYPDILNHRVGGGVPVETHIGAYAPPEHGKSLFSINGACMMARDGHKVVYVGNEDPSSAMVMRMICRLTNKDKLTILKNEDALIEEARSRGLDNLIFAPLSPGTFREIQDLVEKYEARVLVLDQIHQLAVKGANGPLEQLAKASHEARRITKKYGLVTMSLTQAADSARNKRVLDMGDVYGSKVIFPGAVDILVGIGADSGMLDRNERTLSLPKNKISGCHQPMDVRIEPLLSKMTSAGG